MGPSERPKLNLKPRSKDVGEGGGEAPRDADGFQEVKTAGPAKYMPPAERRRKEEEDARRKEADDRRPMSRIEEDEKPRSSANAGASSTKYVSPAQRKKQEEEDRKRDKEEREAAELKERKEKEAE